MRPKLAAEAIRPGQVGNLLPARTDEFVQVLQAELQERAYKNGWVYRSSPGAGAVLQAYSRIGRRTPV